MEKENEDNVQEEKPKKRSLALSRSDFTSLIALIISLGVLVVSLYETKIMRDQQMLMQQQQEAAVYPYLELVKTVSIVDSVYTFNVRVTNHGNGLAIITSQATIIANEKIESQIRNETLEEYEVSRQLSNNLTNNVLSPGNTESIFSFAGLSHSDSEKINALYNDFDVDLCYRSIYKNYWQVSTSDSGFPEELGKVECKN